MIAETAAWAASQGKTLYGLLKEIYVQYGFYFETLVSLTKKGKSGAEEIRDMMAQYRQNPPRSLGGVEVSVVKDYLTSTETRLADGSTLGIDLPKSDVLQFFLSDGSKITVRPSGTEPKIKFYFGAKAPLARVEDFEAVRGQLAENVKRITLDMGAG